MSDLIGIRTPDSALRKGFVTRHCENIDVFQVTATQQVPAIGGDALPLSTLQPAPFSTVGSNEDMNGVKTSELVLTVYDTNLGGLQGRKIFFCASLLSVHIPPGVVHKVSGDPVDGVDPQFTSVDKASGPVTLLNEMLAFSHFVQSAGNDDLMLLSGETAQILITMHDSEHRTPIVGQVVIPAVLGSDAQSNEFPLVDASRQSVMLPNGRQATVRLSYSYLEGQGADSKTALQSAPPGPQPVTEQDTNAKGGAPPPPLSTLKPAPYSLPWDGAPVGVPDGRDLWDELWAPAGRVKQVPEDRDSTPPANTEASALSVYQKDDGTLKRGKRPARAEYRLTAKEQAVKGLKALKQHGWEVIAVGVGDESYALQVHDKLWELGLVDGTSSPLAGENIVFVEDSSEIKDVVKQLGAVMGVIDHDWKTVLSMQKYVEPGCRCVLLLPCSADRDKFREHLLACEKAESAMTDKLSKLNSTIASLHIVEEDLLQRGVDIAQLSGHPHASSKEPGAAHLISQFVKKEALVVQLTQEVDVLAKLSSVPITCCPRTRAEVMLAGGRSSDSWTQACEVFGLDAAIVAVQDGKCIQRARPNGLQGAPFFPLSNKWNLRKTNWDHLCDRGKAAHNAVAGVGIRTLRSESMFVIDSLENGSPSYCSQMFCTGDLILSIDGIVLKDLMTAEVNRLLSGPPGSPVTIGAASTGAPDEVFYVYLTRKCTPHAAKFGKGRLIVVIDEIFVSEEIAPPAERSLLRVRLETARNLPAASSQRDTVFGIVKLSTYSPLQEEQIHSTTPVQRSTPSEFQFEARAFDMDLHDPRRQRIELQLFRQDEHKVAVPESLGRAILSTQEVVTLTTENMREGKWWRLLSHDSMVVVGAAGLPSEVKISAEILSLASVEAEKLKAAPGHVPSVQEVAKAKEQARLAETVGVTLTIDDDYQSIVGNTSEGMQRYGKELSLDLAAALYTSEDRFVLCGLSAGSIIAYVNIVPDKAGVDVRSPKALAILLKDQSRDGDSSLRFASTTKGILAVEVGPSFNAPLMPNAASKIAPDAPTGARSSRETQKIPLAKATTAQEQDMGSAPPAVGKPDAPKERAAVLLSGLADGERRAQDPAMRNLPAIISFTFDDNEPSDLSSAVAIDTMRLEVAHCAHLPPSMVEIGEVDHANRMVDVCIYPGNHLSRLTGGLSAGDQVKNGEVELNGEGELSKVPGMQHIWASQLAWQVFQQGNTGTATNPMLSTVILRHAVWAQCIKEPGNPRTQMVVADMLRPQKTWVSDPTLEWGAWEELQDDSQIRYWLIHEDSVLSKTIPSELWPLPPPWQQRIDHHRRLEYTCPPSDIWQFEHPCASGVVYGVMVRGKGPCMVALRHEARQRGWVGMESCFFHSNPWAKGMLEFVVSPVDGYTSVYDRSQPREVLSHIGGLSDGVVAVYKLCAPHSDVPQVNISALQLPGPGEEFPMLHSSMVEEMVMQYPERSYMVTMSTSSPQPPTGKDFVPVIISCCSGSGQVLHRMCHIAGPGAETLGFQPGWVLVDPGEKPWNFSAEELASNGLVFESVGQILHARRDEYATRLDPFAELPTSRRGVREGTPIENTATAHPFRTMHKHVATPPHVAESLSHPKNAKSEVSHTSQHSSSAENCEQHMKELKAQSQDQPNQGPPLSIPAVYKRSILTVTLKRDTMPAADGLAGLGVGMQHVEKSEVFFHLVSYIYICIMCMYMYIYISMCVYVYMCVYIYIYIYIYTHIYIYPYVYIHIYIYVHTYV